MSIIKTKPEILREVESIFSTIIYENKNLPFSNLTPRQFEVLLALLFEKRFENNNFEQGIQFDRITLMKGVAEQGRDIKLMKNEKNVGLIQCKNVRSVMTKPDAIKEIIKFCLCYINDNSLIEHENNFIYYLVHASGFSGKAITILDSFNSLVCIEPKFEEWTKAVIQEYDTLSHLVFATIKPQLESVLQKISIKYIQPEILCPEIFSYPSILRYFFTYLKVIDVESFNQNLIKMDCEKTYELMNLTSQKIKTTIKDFHFNRDAPKNEIIAMISQNYNFFLTGESMVGKSSMLKEVFNQFKERSHIFLFDEINSNNVDDYFNSHHIQTPYQNILDVFNIEYIFCDQAESLFYSTTLNNFLKDLVNYADSKKIKLIFSCQNHFYEQFQSILLNMRINKTFKKYEISSLDEEQLNEFKSHFHSIPLFNQISSIRLFSYPKILEIITNLQENLILNELNLQISETLLANKIWEIIVHNQKIPSQKVQNSLIREKFLISLASKKIGLNDPFSGNQISESDLNSLISSKVLKKSGFNYLFDHDIYRKWAIIIGFQNHPSFLYSNIQNFSDFFIFLPDILKNLSNSLLEQHEIEKWKTYFDKFESLNDKRWIQAFIEGIYIIENYSFKIEYIFSDIDLDIVHHIESCILPILKQNFSKKNQNQFNIVEYEVIDEYWIPVMDILQKKFDTLPIELKIQFFDLYLIMFQRKDRTYPPYHEKILEYFTSNDVLIEQHQEKILLLLIISKIPSITTTYSDIIKLAVESRNLSQILLNQNYWYFAILNHPTEFLNLIVPTLFKPPQKEHQLGFNFWNYDYSSVFTFDSNRFHSKALSLLMENQEQAALTLITQIIQKGMEIWKKLSGPLIVPPLRKISDTRTPLPIKILINNESINLWGDPYVFSWIYFVPGSGSTDIIRSALLSFKFWLENYFFKDKNKNLQILVKIIKESESLALPGVIIPFFLEKWNELKDDLKKHEKKIEWIEDILFWFIDYPIFYELFFSSRNSIENNEEFQTRIQNLLNFYLRILIYRENKFESLKKRIALKLQQPTIFYKEEEDNKQTLEERKSFLVTLTKRLDKKNIQKIGFNGKKVLTQVLPKSEQEQLEFIRLSNTINLFGLEMKLKSFFRDEKLEIDKEIILEFITNNRKLVEQLLENKIQIDFNNKLFSVLIASCSYLLIRHFDTLNAEIQRISLNIILKVLNTKSKNNDEFYALSLKNCASRCLGVISRMISAKKIKKIIYFLFDYENNRSYSHLPFIFRAMQEILENYPNIVKFTIELTRKEAISSGIYFNNEFFVINERFKDKLYSQDPKQNIDIADLKKKRANKIKHYTKTSKKIYLTDFNLIDVDVFRSVLDLCRVNEDFIELQKNSIISDVLEEIFQFQIDIIKNYIKYTKSKKRITKDQFIQNYTYNFWNKNHNEHQPFDHFASVLLCWSPENSEKLTRLIEENFTVIPNLLFQIGWSMFTLEFCEEYHEKIIQILEKWGNLIIKYNLKENHEFRDLINLIFLQGIYGRNFKLELRNNHIFEKYLNFIPSFAENNSVFIVMLKFTLFHFNFKISNFLWQILLTKFKNSSLKIHTRNDQIIFHYCKLRLKYLYKLKSVILREEFLKNPNNLIEKLNEISYINGLLRSKNVKGAIEFEKEINESLTIFQDPNSYLSKSQIK